MNFIEDFIILFCFQVFWYILIKHEFLKILYFWYKKLDKLIINIYSFLIYNIQFIFCNYQYVLSLFEIIYLILWLNNIFGQQLEYWIV